jgi:general secretion pathway protein H
MIPLLHTKLASRARRALSRGMTLIEILIVMAIIALLTGGLVLGTSQTANAKLRQSATMVSGAVRVAYARASATSKPTRIVFDLENQALWLEEANAPMFVQAKGASAAGGAEAASPEEQQAMAEAERLTTGPKPARPMFRPINDPGLGSAVKGPKPLPRGIEFRSVQTSHDEVVRENGRAYLYFWPGGQTERASVILRIGKSSDEPMTLTVSPLTGKVTVRAGSFPLTLPEDEKAASEREAPGAF